MVRVKAILPRHSPQQLGTSLTPLTQISFGICLTDDTYPRQWKASGPGRGAARARTSEGRRGCRVSDHTHVELLWLEKHIEHWICFGRPAAEQILDRRRRVLSFTPGRPLRLCPLGSQRLRYHRVPHRHPARRTYWCAVRDRSLRAPRRRHPPADRWLGKGPTGVALIDTVEGLGVDPTDAAPDYWRHVHNRLSAGETPRWYTRSRHQARLRRQRIEP